MKVAKEAVAYYCKVTGKAWLEFFNRIDEALATAYQDITDKELWLIKKLLEVVLESITLNELKAGKDDIKGVFDEEGRKNAGEFFTPEVWAAEARKYFDKYIPNWHDYYIWDASCYTMDTLIYVRRVLTHYETKDMIERKVIRDERSTCMYEEGYIHYDDLRSTDMILTINPSNHNLVWCGFYNNFSKVYTGALMTFEYEGGILQVTLDHKMFVNYAGSDILTTADELIIRIEADTDDPIVYIYGDNGKKYLITNYNVESVEELRVWDLTTYNDNHVFFVKEAKSDVGVFSGNCGSGNLMRTANHPADKLFLSSLQEEDIITVKNSPEYEGATAFPLDFLNLLDYDQFNTEFLNQLPPRLKEIIMNDEPLIFFMNPPYKSGMAKMTDVGRLMCDIGLNKSAYDLFYQFCWRVMHFVEMFNLTNTYFCVFGPLTFFSGSSAQVLYNEFVKCFEFVDGMCIPAQDFSGTSESIDWGIGCTFWKSRGGYEASIEPKGVLLEKKVLDVDGNVATGERTLYTSPREKLADWSQPKDVIFYKDAPLATSALTFKGAEIYDKKAKYSGKIAENALGVLMTDSNLARGNSYSAILSMPSTITFINITEENFWRCVANFSFRNSVVYDWSDTKKWNSAPDTSIEGYTEWLMNSLGLFLCELKSMQSSLRDIEWNGEIIDIQNKFHIISAEETRAKCTDPVILQDLETHPAQNQFILEQIEKAKPYWYPEVQELFNWCKEYLLYSLNKRNIINYKGSTNAWDAGLAQIRSVLWSEELSKDLFKRLATVREKLGKDACKFGFFGEYE